MRSDEMEEGQPYALSRPGNSEPLRATLVSLTVDPPRSGWVQVRLEEGTTAGREIKVHARRVLAEWDKRNEPRQRRKARPKKVVDHRPLQAGEAALWPEKSGELEWQLVSVNSEVGTAKLMGHIFGQAQTHEDVPLEALERPTSSGLEAVESSRIEQEEDTEAEQDDMENSAALEPDETALDLPEEFLPRLMERATFGTGLLDRYRRQWAQNKSRSRAAEELQREILQHGKVYRPGRRIKGEYVRIRVGRRYEVIVPESPSTADFTHLKRIIPVRKVRPAKRNRKPASKRRRRRAA